MLELGFSTGNVKKGAARLFSSRPSRERIIQTYEQRCTQIPEKADFALVLGTSLRLYPDKFKKRVFTGTWLVKEGRVPRVIFSGKGDHETNDVDQALDAKELATSKFGLDEGKILTAGGNNTKENLEMVRELLAYSGEKIKDIYVVSSSDHLIRAIPLADHIFKEINVRTHPFPILNEGKVDPDDPRVIEEIIKAIIYNGLLSENPNFVNDSAKENVDRIVRFYTQKTRAMPRDAETSFEEWKITI